MMSMFTRAHGQRIWLACCLALFLAFMAVPPAASAKPGDLDRSFGKSGRVIGEPSGFVDMATLTDGSIVVATESTLFAYQPNGHRNAQFGDNGAVHPLSPEGAPVTINDLSVDGDGRIVVVGSAGRPFVPGMVGCNCYGAIARYLPDGKLDEDFGSGGIVFTDLALPPPIPPSVPSYYAPPVSAAVDVRAAGAAVDSHERIVLTGTRAATYAGTKSFTFAPVPEAFVARLRPSGDLDPSFGANGTALLGGLGSIGRPALDRQDGVYFVAGPQVRPYEFSEEPRIVGHLTSSGVVDQGFGKGGWRALTDDSSESDVDVTLDRKGRLLICEQGSPAGIERFKPNGSIDRSFGHNGIKTIVRSKGEVMIGGLAVTGSGGILAAGTLRIEPISANAEPKWRLLLARLTPRGTLARRFGSRGTVVTSFGASAADGQAVLADGAGRAVVGGERVVENSRLILARYLLR